MNLGKSCIWEFSAIFSQNIKNFKAYLRDITESNMWSLLGFQFKPNNI